MNPEIFPISDHALSIIVGFDKFALALFLVFVVNSLIAYLIEAIQQSKSR